MARILYGVSGEGSGHAIRSREVVRHLEKQGHSVLVMTYGRASRIFDEHRQFFAIEGLHLAYRNNNLKHLQTGWDALWQSARVVKSFQSALAVAKKFQPELVITDFEPLVARIAAECQLPLLSVDNIHHLVFSKLRPLQYVKDRMVAYAAAKLFIPRADQYIVTVLSPTDFNRSDVVTVPPIIRENVLQQVPSTGSHVVVYDSFANPELPSVLRQVKGEFRVYGFHEEIGGGNLVQKKFNEAEFVRDVATARGVIGTGGFTLISECMALKKPYLAIPVAHHYEQIENGLTVEKLGVGAMSLPITTEAVELFLDHLSSYESAYRQITYPGNQPAFQIIDEAIERLVGDA